MKGVPFTFGSWVRQRRKAASLTQEALAALVPCSADLIRKIESGARHRPPSGPAAGGVPGRAGGAPRSLVGPRPGRPAPALEALRPRSTLPRPPTPLIGRRAEISLVRQRLEEASVVTLLGPPGSGKSRLAIAVAAGLRDSFPAGVFCVDLTAVRGPDELPLTLAQTLRLDDGTARTAEGRLRPALRERQALLVLDNFEQILPAPVGIAALAAACP